MVGAVGLGLGTYFILSGGKKTETALVTRAALGAAHISLVQHW